MKKVNDDTLIAVSEEQILSDEEAGGPSWRWTGFSVQDVRERLVGATVVGVQVEDDEWNCSPWPYLIVRTKAGEHVALGIGRDSEGNGGGFLHIEELGA